jgi:ankyrin repeat protein
LPLHAVSPASARAEDATGALPLHWATRNPDVSFEMIDLLLKAYPDAPTKTDNKVSFCPRTLLT